MGENLYQHKSQSSVRCSGRQSTRTAQSDARRRQKYVCGSATSIHVQVHAKLIIIAVRQLRSECASCLWLAGLWSGCHPLRSHVGFVLSISLSWKTAEPEMHLKAKNFLNDAKYGFYQRLRETHTGDLYMCVCVWVLGSYIGSTLSQCHDWMYSPAPFFAYYFYGIKRG